jgi:hypothetical protein
MWEVGKVDVVERDFAAKEEAGNLTLYSKTLEEYCCWFILKWVLL